MTEIIATPAHKFNKPWYTLEVTATGVGIDVRMNDIHIDQEAYGGHSTTEFEVGTSIINGINELKIIIYPFFVKDDQIENFHIESEVKATLYVQEKVNTDGKKYVVSHIHINPNLPVEQMVKGSAIIDSLAAPSLDFESKPLNFPGRSYKKQIVVTRKTLPIKSPYPRWAWQDGQTITDTEENFTTLLAAYKQLHEAFSKSDMETIFAIHAPRSREYAMAYYLGDSVEKSHKFMSTGKILDDPGAELFKLTTKSRKLEIYANGKLARIVNSSQHHPIVFLDRTKGLIHTMKYGFYKNKNGEWVLIR